MATRASNHRPKRDQAAHRIGFFGESGAGKTTVSSLVADRLSERGEVAVLGAASSIVDIDPVRRPTTGSGLEMAWTVRDAEAGVESLERASDGLDTAFVVATPDTLDSASAYGRVADRTDTDLFLIVSRFTEADRERVRAFDGPEIAEYFYEDEAVNTAIAANEVPDLGNWTVEAVLIEALQPERLDLDSARDALDTGRRSVVNVEVSEKATGAEIVRSFRSHGFRADYFSCNCQCHDGHVIARSPSADCQS